MGRTLEQVIADHWDSNWTEADNKCLCGHSFGNSYTEAQAQRHLRDEINVWMMRALTMPDQIDSYRRMTDQWEDDGGWVHPADPAIAEFLGYLISTETEVDYGTTE